VVAVLGWRGLDSIVRAREVLNLELEHTRGLQLTFAQMHNDCDKIAAPATVGNRPVLDARGGRLTLVRMVFTESEPSRVQVVAYRLRDGVLTRRESLATRDMQVLEQAWAAALVDADASSAVTLHSGVQGMALRAWFANGGWRTPGAPLQGAGQGPTGLEVALELRDGRGRILKNFLLGAV
jgi:general secretion pathway protein J